jgi:hypothetical protein
MPIGGNGMHDKIGGLGLNGEAGGWCPKPLANLGMDTTRLAPVMTTNEMQTLKKMLDQQRADMAAHTGIYSTDPITSNNGRMAMLRSRLRIAPELQLPFDQLYTLATEEKVFVVFMHDNQLAMLEDHAGLYPSDTLITQLRLIAK